VHEGCFETTMGVRRKFNSNPQVLQPPDDLTSDRALMSCEVLEGGMLFIISVMTRFEVQKGQQDLEQYEISYICVFLNALLLLLPVSPCEALTMAFRTNTFALLQQENPGVKPLSCCLIFLQGSISDREQVCRIYNASNSLGRKILSKFCISKCSGSHSPCAFALFSRKTVAVVQ